MRPSLTPMLSAVAGLLALAGSGQLQANCTYSDLNAALKSTYGASFQPAMPGATRRASLLFTRHFSDRASPLDEREYWQTLGFKVELVCEEKQRWWLIREPKANAEGRGAFIFAIDASRPVILQAPHQRADWGTGRLAIHWLREGRLRALALNTAPRRRPGESGDGEADLAHMQFSFLQAFTEAQARGLPGSRLIQLHGFSNARRKGPAGRDAAIILSAGRPQVSAPARQTHACLSAAIDAPVRLYPVDIHELGGTRNVQGQLFRQLGQDGFLHLEISRRWRERLLDNAALRKTVLACLLA